MEVRPMKVWGRTILAFVAIGEGLIWALLTEYVLSVAPSVVAPHPISGYFWENFGILWALWSIFWHRALGPYRS